MTSQAKLPFITLKMRPNEYHQQMPILLDYAKTKGLYDYVIGNETVKYRVFNLALLEMKQMIRDLIIQFLITQIFVVKILN